MAVWLFDWTADDWLAEGMLLATRIPPSLLSLSGNESVFLLRQFLLVPFLLRPFLVARCHSSSSFFAIFSRLNGNIMLVAQFRTANKLYYKNSTTTQLDEQFGDIKGIIADIEASIVRQLSGRVLEQASTLQEIGKCIYEMDWSAGLAVVPSIHSLFYLIPLTLLPHST